MAAPPLPASSKLTMARLNVVSCSSTSPQPKGAGERRAGAAEATTAETGKATATPTPSSTSSSSSSPSPLAAAAKNAAAASLWIALSATVILFNKRILTLSGFPFPVSLTAWHMLFSWGCSAALVHLTSLVELPAMTVVVTTTTPTSAPSSSARDAEKESLTAATTTTKKTIRGLDTKTYLRRVAPVGALFAGTLWLGNAAYLHLSVSLVQMLKALMPAAVYGVGCVLGTEEFKRSRAANMAIVTLGVAAASAGEVSLSALGIALQLGSIATESTRLALVQILLQQKKKKKKKTSAPSAATAEIKNNDDDSNDDVDNKISLNPVTTMYYLAPASLLCLSLPWLAFERAALAEAWRSGGGIGSSREISSSSSSSLLLFSWWKLKVSPLTLVANASLAFALNLSVFLLIGRTSALAMNVAGVVKDWLLIGLSAALFHSPVTRLNLVGYSIAFAGVCWYNKAKFDEMREEGGAAKAAAKAKAAAAEADEAGAAGSAAASDASELKPLMASSRGALAVSSSSSSYLSDDRKIKAGRAV